MSYDTQRNWLYELYGRKIHLWQWVETAATDTVGSYRVKLPSEFYGNQLIYPNEDITNGLRVEYTALYEPFVSEALEDMTARAGNSTINFQIASSAFHTADDVLFTASTKTLSSIANANQKFYVGQSLAITNSGYNNGTKTVATVSSTSLTIAETVLYEGNGAVLTVDDTTPTPTGSWQGGQTHTEVTQLSTSGSGRRMQVTIVTGGDGSVVTFTITSGGENYAVDDTIVFRDPGSTLETATLTVASLRGDVSIANNANAILGGSAGTDTFADFAANDKIRVIGSASNDADYTISSKSSNGDAIVPSSAPSALESSGESITIYQIPSVVADASVDETSHVNLNRLLSLAVVDYVKAQVSLDAGNVELKEYYMRDFHKKIADDQSNRRKISITFPVSNFAVR